MEVYMKKVLTICFLFLLLCGCNSKNNINNQSIDCNKKNELLNNGAILIDVRTEEEYAISHLDNSINIPVDEILVVLVSIEVE